MASLVSNLSSLTDALSVISVPSLKSLPFDSIYLAFVLKFVVWWALAFTSARSRMRPIAFLIVIITGLAANRSPTVHLIPGGVACDWIISMIFHSSNLLLIAKRIPPPEANTVRKRAYWAFIALYSPRWNVTDLPKFSDSTPSYIPTRSRLFFERAMDFLICYPIALQFSKCHIYSYRDPGGFFGRLDEVTQQELVLRLFLMLKGYVIPYLTLRACYALATCVALIFGAQPKKWPPLFGSIKNAYTVRRFYSHFWHHAMRRALTAHGALITYYFLWVVNLSRPKSLRSPAARYMTTIFTFVASAGMHALAIPGIELHMVKPELWLHLGTAAAIMFEDLVIKTYLSATCWLEQSQRKLKGIAREHPDIVAASSSCITGAEAVRRKDKRKQQSKRDRSDSGQDEKGQSSIFDVIAASEQKGQKHQSQISRMIWHGIGYVWVTSFWTWTVSDLLFAAYNV